MQCKAKSSQTGSQCKRHAIKGGVVCATHGGRAPQVKRKAASRVAELVDPAIDIPEKTIKGDNILAAVALAAAKDILDRAGLKAIDKLEITTKSSEDAILLAEIFSPQELKDIRRRILDHVQAKEKRSKLHAV